jgi:hypothetical protein
MKYSDPVREIGGWRELHTMKLGNLSFLPLSKRMMKQGER